MQYILPTEYDRIWASLEALRNEDNAETITELQIYLEEMRGVPDGN